MIPQSLPRWLRTGLAVALVMMLAVLVTRTAVGAFRPHLYAGTVLRGESPAPPLDRLHFTSGEAVDLEQFDDEVTILFFGFTWCPDVCPTTLSRTAQAFGMLDEDQRARTNLVMVSVDPARDDPESLEQYMEFFDPSFRGATGAVEAIDRVASLYGVFYELGEGSIEDGYDIDHTATLMGIGTDGTLRVVWPPDVEPEQLSADIQQLLR